MVTEEKEKKEKAPVEEKRVKATVIRRRQKAVVSPPPAKAEGKKAEAAEKKAVKEKAAGAPAGEAVEKEVKKPRRGRPRKEPAEKAPVTAEPAPPVEAAAPAPGSVSEEAPPAAAPKEEVKPVVSEKKPTVVEKPSRKEVKVFEKETELKKFYTRPVKKGRKWRHERKGTSSPKVARKTEIAVIPTKTEKKVVRMAEVISVSDLSQRLGVKANEIIRKLMALGVMATVNQLIGIDAATLIAQEYGYEVETVGLQEEALMEEEKVTGHLEPRAPVVTVMGHVDHGKTSLLDAIRKTNVVGGEAGGITQHIGAYDVHLERGDVTFLDTPGHEAFTAMRARGAKATDIVVLVVAADDGVMPQTIEAINHAKAAGVPIIVAVNKVDLPQAEPSRVKNELMKYNLVPEDLGGETIFVEVSAKKGVHIKELLEMVLLQAEMLELQAAKDIPARGVIIEAKLDKGRGPVATVLIQNGTLHVGDPVVAGFHFGRVRAMITDRGKRIDDAGPSIPVEILGLSGVPQAGDTFMVAKDEVTARQIASIRERKAIEQGRVKVAKVSLADLHEQIQKGETKELNSIVKADVHGSIEAVKEALGKLSTDAIKIKFIHSAVGGINESDVMLASASNAIIIGFNVRPDTKAQALAEKENVDIRLYNIIYDLVDDVKSAMEGLLAPIVREEIMGRVEIREVFRITKVGPVAGCYVTSGKVQRGARARLIRDNVVIYDGRVGSLKRFKEDVREVSSGFECGLTIEGYNDIKAGDIVEPYVQREEAARL